MAGSDNESDDASVHSEATIAQQQQNIQPQIITTVSNNNAKFPYLKKDEYEVWAMKMEYWITNNDMNIWKVIQNGNSLKRTGRDRDGRSIPDDHVADFHYMVDARDIWNAVKARFGGNAKSKKIRKYMLKQEFSEFIISEAEGLHKGFTFIMVLGPSHSAFVSTTSASKKMSYADSPSYSSSTYTAPSNSKTRSHRSGNVIEEGAAKIYNLITRANTKEASTAGDAGEFALMGVTFEDDSAFSVFTTNSEEVEGRPLFNRFAKADSMKAMPPPLSGDYTPLSDHIDLDESQMSYGTKSSTSGDSNSMSNDFVSCDNSDKSSEVNINDFASSDSSVISSEPKSKNSTSYASTSSVSTSESEAE
ncbi:hypothetical protein Tco_1291349 [Tanacetum coccineum]